MAIFHPFVEAVQWTGTNITEIRQFVRANQGYFNNAVIRDGVLYLQTFAPDSIAGSAEIAVPVNNWVVREHGNVMLSMTDALFTSQFTP